MMKRPQLSIALTAEEFAAWYWLKQELVTFCRERHIPSSGSKLDLEGRIGAYLDGRKPTDRSSLKRRAGAMPTAFTLETVIGEGWRCGPTLGAFMRQVVGSGFHFNAEVRDFIHNSQGRTLAEAVICYRNSVRPGRAKAAIPRQLEYNQHFRDYFREHPGASKQEAIAAWWARRRTRFERE